MTHKTDEKVREVFECLSCSEVWKGSYAPGHECPACGTNNVTEFDFSNQDEISSLQSELTSVRAELVDAKENWEHFADLHKEAQNITIPALKAELEQVEGEVDENKDLDEAAKYYALKGKGNTELLRANAFKAGAKFALDQRRFIKYQGCMLTEAQACNILSAAETALTKERARSARLMLILKEIFLSRETKLEDAIMLAISNEIAEYDKGSES